MQRVVRRSDTQLILESNTWLFSTIIAAMLLGFVWLGLFLAAEGLWFIGIPLALGLGGLFLYLLIDLTERAQLILDRTEGTIVLRRRTMRGRAESVHPLAELRGPGIESVLSGRTRTHRLVLRMAQGPLPFTAGFVSGPSARRLAEAVADWTGLPIDPDAHPPPPRP